MSTKKTYLTVVTVVVLLSVAVPLLVLHKPWKGTKVATSELYNRYADKEGIEASFIKDYKVNDSVFVDVTLLEAKNDSSWTMLRKEYKVPEPTPKQKSDMEKGSPCIAFCSLPDLNFDSEYSNDNTLVIAIYNGRAIYVFYSKMKSQNDAIIDMFIDKYFSNKT